MIGNCVLNMAQVTTGVERIKKQIPFERPVLFQKLFHQPDTDGYSTMKLRDIPCWGTFTASSSRCDRLIQLETVKRSAINIARILMLLLP